MDDRTASTLICMDPDSSRITVMSVATSSSSRVKGGSQGAIPGRLRSVTRGPSAVAPGGRATMVERGRRRATMRILPAPIIHHRPCAFPIGTICHVVIPGSRAGSSSQAISSGLTTSTQGQHRL